MRWLSGKVLLIRDFFHPHDTHSIECLHDCDVSHCCGGRGSVPVLVIRRAPNYVAGANLYDRLPFTLRPSTARGDYQNLPQWMCVPRCSRTRFKRYGSASNAGRCRRVVKRVASDAARKTLFRSGSRGLGTIAYQNHDEKREVGCLDEGECACRSSQARN